MGIIIKPEPIISSDPLRVLPEIGVRAEAPQPIQRSMRVLVPRRRRFRDLIASPVIKLAVVVRTRRSRLVIVVSIEEAANDGEENKHDVEGVPAMLHCLRSEDVGSEGVQGGDHDEGEDESENEEEYGE